MPHFPFSDTLYIQLRCSIHSEHLKDAQNPLARFPLLSELSTFDYDLILTCNDLIHSLTLPFIIALDSTMM